MAQSSPYLIPSLIGGISEQAPQDRPPSTCEDQENCVNDPLNGCTARPGGEVVGAADLNMKDPFVHDIRRSGTEHYKVFIEDGQIAVVNILNGQLCSMSGDIEDYLTHTGPARLAFSLVTVEDTTFIVNKQRTVLMDDTLSPARDNKAIFYFRAGAYSTVYRAAIRTASGTYWADYTTPDNTDPENAKFITTRRLAAELRDAFLALQAAVAPGINGFTFTKDGSNVHIERSSSTPFDIDSEDGIGDTQLIGITEWVSKFENLPGRAPHNYVVGVRGSKADQRDDYWLQYKNGSTTGYWKEIVKPETPTSLDASTMPHLLLNVGANDFEVSVGTWNTRISGDGILSAKDPAFVGRKIQSANFISGRLALMTAGTFSLSRARNAFCFFPDTAQTRLDTDPIGFEIANGRSTIINTSVTVSGKLFFWGDENQMRLDSGDQPLTEEFADIIPSTNYEFDGLVSPIPMGMSGIMFGTAMDTAVRLKEVMYRNGSPIGEMPLNDHCPKLVQGTLRQIAVGGAAGLLVALTSQKKIAYIYQWLNQGDQRAQSAWNRWTFPMVDRIVSAAVRGNVIYLLFQIGSKLVTERFRIDPADQGLVDVRLDHRLSHVGATYEDGVATLTLPYSVAESDRSSFKAIFNDSAGEGSYGGLELDVAWLSSTSVEITMPEDGQRSYFWFGAVPNAARLTLSQLYVQTKQGTLLPDRNLIDKLKISHDKTSEYRVEIRDVVNDKLVYDHPFHGKESLSAVANNRLGKTRAEEKNFSVDRKSHEVEITLINDTIYPSRWVQAEYSFAATR